MFGEKSVSAMLRHVESISTALSVSSLVVPSLCWKWSLQAAGFVRARQNKCLKNYIKIIKRQQLDH